MMFLIQGHGALWEEDKKRHQNLAQGDRNQVGREVLWGAYRVYVSGLGIMGFRV